MLYLFHSQRFQYSCQTLFSVFGKHTRVVPGLVSVSSFDGSLIVFSDSCVDVDCVFSDSCLSTSAVVSIRC